MEEYIYWIYNHQYQVFMGAFMVFLCLCLCIGAYQKLRDTWMHAKHFVPMLRRTSVLRKERAKFVDKLVADDITEMIEYRVFSKSITREEANQRYRKLASLLSNKSLYPDPKLLKTYIRDRIEAKEHKKVPLPDSSSKNIVKMEDFGGKFIKRRKAA